MERTAIPAIQKDLDTLDWGIRKEWLRSVKLDNDVIEVRFTSKVGANQKDKALQQMHLDLKTFFQDKIKAKVAARPYKLGSLYGVDFTLTMPDTRAEKRQLRMDSSTLRFLEEKLNLTPTQAAGLVKSLNQLARDESEHL